MSNSVIPNLYRDIINKVIEDARVDFESYNIDESILDELRITWEKKLFESRVADFSFIEEDEYYGEPAAAAAPAAPAPAPVPAAPVAAAGAAAANPQMPPMFQFNAPVMGSFAPEGRPRPPPASTQPNASDAVPQYDGPADDVESASSSAVSTSASLSTPAVASSHVVSPMIQQVDGADDDPDDDPDAINSDLDDDDEDADDEADAEAQNQILCLYEKVNRTKNKWKCTMREGIIHVNGKDYAFSRLTGDYQF
ncbi:transcription factor IIA, alpha/beta subunit [Catenaria anguillulae PL171]|uniref:Transcription factor IIA, alpha/beta subunit n=1 Tax=Catenaria anguillulae PL171 TaxID=765915 RepID=A0A1Y2HD09_9FUNG|nr:transcription factor IIA, alpha/beta subunit [Catenaria anguillulae PL171]